MFTSKSKINEPGAQTGSGNQADCSGANGTASRAGGSRAQKTSFQPVDPVG